MSKRLTDEGLLREMQPKVETLVEDHLKMAKEWFPHTYVPWERGVELTENTEWDPNAFKLSDAVRSALFVNLLTEDNLPYYHEHIADTFKKNTAGHEVWKTWTQRWTAEEDRHAIVIRDYLIVTQAIDPFMLERARMEQMSKGEVPRPPGIAETLAYVSLQELATRIAHRNTGEMLKEEDQAGEKVMKRVAQDENLHFIFYRNAFAELLKIDPSTGMVALEKQVRDFAMPGTGIPNYKRHAARIANAGIYNEDLHYDQILVPVVKQFYDIENKNLELDDEGERARDGLEQYIEEKRQEFVERAEKRKAKLGRLANKASGDN